MVGVSVVDSVAAAVYVQRLRAGVEQHRHALDSLGVRFGAGVSRVSVVQVVAARAHSGAGLGACRAWRMRDHVLVGVRRAVERAARSADHRGFNHRPHRPGAGAGRRAPLVRRAADGHRRHLPVVCVLRPLGAGSHRLERRELRQSDVAHVAHPRRRVRRGLGRVDIDGVFVRAVRFAAGARRRRQLFHLGGVLVAGSHARRAGQGRGGVVRPHRLGVRLVHRQCGHHRHLHYSADETRRLPRGEGRSG